MTATSAIGSPPRSLRGDIFGLLAFLTVCFAVAGVGGAVTAGSVDTWYRTLDKASFTPPDWVFGPAWSILYAAMAVAAWRIWRRTGLARGRTALTLFAIQLLLNGLWSILFFGAHRPGAALADIVLLWFAILATTLAFWRIDRVAGVLFLPYLLWVGYAAVLNLAIWLRN
ncbi:MAG: tryptophan-rich sensory protein [Rhodospirillales bacterium]|nr:tryptophan-rich sensory protein [Rhodospirillales bacterium]